MAILVKDLGDDGRGLLLNHIQSQAFQERPWNGRREVQMKRVVETQGHVLADACDVLSSWLKEINGRDVADAIPVLVQQAGSRFVCLFFLKMKKKGMDSCQDRRVGGWGGGCWIEKLIRAGPVQVQGNAMTAQFCDIEQGCQNLLGEFVIHEHFPVHHIALLVLVEREHSRDDVALALLKVDAGHINSI